MFAMPIRTAQTAAAAVMLAVLPGSASGRLGYTLVGAPDHGSQPMDAGSPGFDQQGLAYVRAGTRLLVLRNGRLIASRDFEAAARIAVNRDIPVVAGKWDGKWDSSFMNDTSIVFDDSGRAYTLLIPRYSNLNAPVLLWSDDGARSWRGLWIPGRNAALERPDGFNDHSGPPTVISFENYGGATGTRLWLNSLKVQNGTIVRDGGPVLVSDHSALAGNHSGAANSTFTTPDKVFITYNTTDRSAPGTLIAIRQFDRASRRLEGEEVLLGRSSTLARADVHDIPAITMGPDGRLIVIIGAHQAPFKWVQATVAHSAIGGWGPATPIVGPGGPNANRFTYVSLATARDGTINLIARLTSAEASYPLVQLRKPWRKPWQVWGNGDIYRILADPDRAHYAAWRQRLTVDRRGRLYINFRYYPNMLTDQEAALAGLADTPKHSCQGRWCWYQGASDIAPATLVSADTGLTWH